jgi:hypothetical protein
VTSGDPATRGSTRPRASGTPRSARKRAERRRAERRLRRAVSRLRTCIDDLRFGQRRVLVLRAGIGAADPRTRRGVARVLDLRVRQVLRIERRALRNARRLARTDGCGSAAAGVPPIMRQPEIPTDTGPVLSAAPGPSGGGDGGGSGGSPDGRGASGGGGSGEVRGESSTQLPPELGGTGEGGGRDTTAGTSLWVAAALMLLAGLAGFAMPTLRDRLRGSGRTQSAG